MVKKYDAYVGQIDKCLDCGKTVKGLNRYCPICSWKHGEIYILDMETWQYTKINRDTGENFGIVEETVPTEETEIPEVTVLELW